ncbi:MAG: SRPBCC family protein [Hyphomonadaceae bacterium]
MTGNTVRLHRVIAAKPEKVYKAFIDADAKAQWLPPNGFTGKVHHQDVRVGGEYKMSFTNFSTGNSHSWGGRFLELVPAERVVYSDKFDDPNMPGEMTVTVVLKRVPSGTEISIEQANVPSMIPLDGCYLGWQQSLVNLATLVEPNIPD